MSKLNLLQLQTRVLEDKLENVRALEPQLAQAARAGTDLVTLPEMFCCPYETERFPVFAEPEGGPVWTALAALAARYGVYLSAGTLPERGEDGRVYNTAYVFDRQGRQIAKHRKAHLFDIDVQGGQYFKESDTLTAGDGVTVFDTEFGRMGLCVCYDLRFPELARLMALEGARVLLVPAAFNMTTGPAHWELMFRARALDNQVFAVGTAPAQDLSASYHSWGHSIAVDPWGAVLAQMDEGTGSQAVELDLDRVDAVRRQLPLLRHRRTDLYELKKGADSMKPVTPAYGAENKGHYAAGMISRGMLYVSGQLSLDPDTRTLPEGGPAAHARQALANLDRVLREAGAAREQVVLCRVYLPDVAFWDEVNEAYAAYFGSHRPARVIVPTSALHYGCMVEIEAIAELEERV